MTDLSFTEHIINGEAKTCPMSSGNSVPIASCDHCGKSDNLFKCSSCKLAQYCDRNCQRANWPKHKVICKRNITVSNNKSSKVQVEAAPTGMKCPYKPGNIQTTTATASPGVCPYKDSVEDGRVTLLVRQKLDDGIDGMKELACLAKSGKMAITEPLQDAFEEVLAIAENKLSDISRNLELIIEVCNANRAIEKFYLIFVDIYRQDVT